MQKTLREQEFAASQVTSSVKLIGHAPVAFQQLHIQIVMGYLAIVDESWIWCDNCYHFTCLGGIVRQVDIS